ncbi:MAG: metallopeptidase family protein [Clostridia bacterium]|nr:metallopeptidase family protein [Clostridia bacterium]MBQ9994642.1 metallopeptidase family protein [Clostridia bacterium]
MIPIEQFEALADDVSMSLPRELFRHLNGGILILPQMKLHERSLPDRPLYVLGEYNRAGVMGRYISIYYGSFARVYEHLSPDDLRERLRATIAHEFRHHMESLSGERDLEIEDEVRLSQYTAQGSLRSQ